jgi:hypothetical protein
VSARRTTEAGSAYLLALLVLLVLSLLGLSLALVGQEEQQLGGNDLQAQRTLYAAETGVQMGLARLLATGSSVERADVAHAEPLHFTLVEERPPSIAGAAMPAPAPARSGFEERVEVSPLVPIRDAFCDLCPAGEGDVQLHRVEHAVSATATRVSAGAAAAPGARKQIFVMVTLQPWWAPSWQAIADAAQAEQVVQETLGGNGD